MFCPVRISNLIYKLKDSTHGGAGVIDAHALLARLSEALDSLVYLLRIHKHVWPAPDRLIPRLSKAVDSVMVFLRTHKPDLQPAPARHNQGNTNVSRFRTCICDPCRKKEILPTRAQAASGLSPKVTVETSAPNCVLLDSGASFHSVPDFKTLLDMCLLCTLRIPGGVNCSAITSVKEGGDTNIASFMTHLPKCLSDPDSDGGKHGMKSVMTETSASWVVATAAPHHATGNRALLSGFITEHDGRFVHSINGVPMPVCAQGAVVTDAVILPDVWFIPGLTSNLVSVSQLSELDYSVGFGCGTCCIRSAGSAKIIGKAHLKEGQYVLDFLKVPLAM